ncbi:hypothetical protein [Paenibacillus polymyxa]|uniref:hypothetical protein n=1 Tax=Paenibacillus polymyxa TaxID=1406 RepID=UPI0007E92FDE|nr:hypothetical protein [Paenibacillus polymyxa]MDN4081409.1 hypothetical protein [Paenibacillus polymyxa]MDN4109736.1 hypothetical protein [Paenibacillus polymyxa]OAZ42746.1 hypothetical protein A9Z39_22605 [Paenibacillus polymyxa]
MDIVFLILVLISATFLCWAINRIFNIVYFGFKGILALWIGCAAISAFVLDQALTFIINHFGWFLAGAILLITLIIIVKRKFGKQSEQHRFEGSNEEKNI